MSQAAADTLVREGDELFRAERFAEAASRFERAVAVFPQHALGWRGLGHALLSLGKPHEAAAAFDQAIGLRAESATALWGGALAHAETGNKVIAREYLRRTIALQPTWAEMALGVPLLAGFVQVSARAGDRLRAAFGAFETQRYHHATQPERGIEIGRIAGAPALGRTTFVSIGLSNAEWDASERPRVELVLASSMDGDACARIVANFAFHLADTRLFPEPGTMVRDVVGALELGELSERLPHMYVQSPRAWRASPGPAGARSTAHAVRSMIALPLDEGPPAITLAQVVPISEHEYQTWKGVGAQRFERTLSDRGVDVSDLGRRGD